MNIACNIHVVIVVDLSMFISSLILCFIVDSGLLGLLELLNC
jgi:hypothetical protein